MNYIKIPENHNFGDDEHELNILLDREMKSVRSQFDEKKLLRFYYAQYLEKNYKLTSITIVAVPSMLLNIALILF